MEQTRQRRDGSTRTTSKGQITIMVTWTWRIERPRSILLGSSHTKRVICNGIQKLAGSKVVEVSIEGRLPELVVRFSNNHWLHSFMTYEGQPEWSILFEAGTENVRWIHSEQGKLYLQQNNSLHAA